MDLQHKESIRIYFVIYTFKNVRFRVIRSENLTWPKLLLVGRHFQQEIPLEMASSESFWSGLVEKDHFLAKCKGL